MLPTPLGSDPVADVWYGNVEHRTTYNSLESWRRRKLPFIKPDLRIAGSLILKVVKQVN